MQVLEVMKARTVKNAVIVPVGAKGGFVVKRPPTGDDRAALREEVVECYRIFMRGLLDITDTILGRRRSCRRATSCATTRTTPTSSSPPTRAPPAFSTSATRSPRNTASGSATPSPPSGSARPTTRGSASPRGAWESMKRHFRELGTDVERTDFSVIGIGDMSGDVFGNGMLLSRHTRLLGAFDHRHVFLDPDPGRGELRRAGAALPAARLVVGRTDGLISPGGGVYPRTLKTIDSTRGACCRSASSRFMTPNELIHALLLAPVDLLWNGGIGYVKARAELLTPRSATSRRRGPRRCRRPALPRGRRGRQPRLTQRARANYALGGGRIDGCDRQRSAGVDCSDHEVNIKILLDSIVAEGDLTGKQRNALLAEMADEVAALVSATTTSRPRRCRRPLPRPPRWSRCTSATFAASSRKAC